MLIQTTYSLVKIEEFRVTAAELVDEPFRSCAEVRIPPSKNRPRSYTAKDWSSEPLAGSSECITKWFPAGLSGSLDSYQLTNPWWRHVPSSKSMNSALSSLKKFPCWFWLAVDSVFGKVLGFVCGRRSIKTARRQFKQLKGCYHRLWHRLSQNLWKSDRYSFASPR